MYESKRILQKSKIVKYINIWNNDNDIQGNNKYRQRDTQAQDGLPLRTMTDTDKSKWSARLATLTILFIHWFNVTFFFPTNEIKLREMILLSTDKSLAIKLSRDNDTFIKNSRRTTARWFSQECYANQIM